MAGFTVKEQLYHFVDDLEKSLSYDPREVFDCDSILLCGVGGSAVSGDFAADCCYAESSKFLCLMKYPELPSWVGPRTLAIVSSYSGNTAETMHMYHQAKARGRGRRSRSRLSRASIRSFGKSCFKTLEAETRQIPLCGTFRAVDHCQNSPIRGCEEKGIGFLLPDGKSISSRCFCDLSGPSCIRSDGCFPYALR